MEAPSQDTEENTGQQAPHEEYSRRLRDLLVEESSLGKRSNALGVAKLVAIALTLIAGFALAKYDSAWLPVLIAPVVAILALFVLHDRALKALRRAKRRKNLYDRGLARLEDRWVGTGESGERFLDPNHPYARDLDLFGKGGLFELLSTARTRAGEETLASWLLAPAPVDEITARQAAIADLRPRLDFREKLALAGEDADIGVRPQALVAWATGKVDAALPAEKAGPPNRMFARIATLTLGTLWILSIVIWGTWGFVGPVIVLSVLNLVLTYRFRAGVERTAAEIEAATSDLDLLSAVFRQMEAEHFIAAKLIALQDGLRSSKEPASAATASLARIVAWLEGHENLIVKFFDLFVFWTVQWVWAAEAWRARYGIKISDWLTTAGEMEALSALAGYAYEHPDDTFPNFVEDAPRLHAKGLAHPLLQPAYAVANDLDLNRDLQLIVISGPNMAGKSTFIRSVGVNVVLAQAGAPVRAEKMVLSPLAVTASICVLDSLQGGLSRFYAEITRLKAIDRKSRGHVPVLFLLDELLSGTNSHDRRVGTESFVRSLLSRGAIGLVTTHDLALAAIAEGLNGHAANFHFEDRFENGELRFNYRLTPGVVSTTNALDLMRSVGLEV